MVVHKPAGTVVSLPQGSTSFAETDEPGVYTIDLAAGPRSFVVNLDPAESKTAPLGVETLEQFGCRLVNPSRTRVDRELLRQMQNAELESRQKLWRWLILAAIGVLIAETWLAGRIKRPSSGSRGGPVDMSGKLRQALEQVARRFRRVRLWGGLAACWLTVALVGCGIAIMKTGTGGGSIPAGWQLATLAILAAVSGLACALLALRSARDPRWVARRIEAKHPELGTELLAAVEEVEAAPGGRLGFLQAAVVREALEHRRSHNWDETVPTWLIRVAKLAHAAALVLLLLVSASMLVQVRSSAFGGPGGGWQADASEVQVDPGDTELERGSSLLVIARFQSRRTRRRQPCRRRRVLRARPGAP